MKIITKTEAKRQGLTQYYTGKPCKNGHVATRYTKTSRCSECKKNNDTNSYTGYNTAQLKYRNSEKGKENRYRLWLKFKYGITPEQWNVMYTKQNGCCAICKKQSGKLKSNRKLAVDHCHDTNIIRGLLCQACNTAIGKLHHDITILQNAIDYLSEFNKCE